ncbi:MAG: glycosyltransferase family 39 protein, partial [Kiritimatiellae bacterium]|nr:glycosyltransferase family 39 protein [Kiritimatiellia bacterium]
MTPIRPFLRRFCSTALVLSGVLLLAFLLRIGIGVYLGFDSGPDRAACGADTVEFEQMAWSAAKGHGFRLTENGPLTAFRAPGYPFFLAGLYRMFGRRFWVNRVALSVVGTLTCFLVYLLVRRLGMTSGVALLATFITAVLPLQFYWCGHFMSEPLSAFLNVATCFFMTAGVRQSDVQSRVDGLPAAKPSRSWLRWMLGAGVLCGLSALVRAGALLVPVAFAVLMLLSRAMPWRRCFLSVLVLLLGTLLVLAPWAIRNRLALDRWVLISTNGGSTFWGANNALVARPGEHWGSWVSTSHVDRKRKEREVWLLKNEADQDRREWQIGLEFLRTNPRLVPLLLVGKLYRLLTPFVQSTNRIYVAAVALGQIGLLPATLAGMLIFLRKPD